MRVALEFNLTEDLVVVHWPWGRGEFTISDTGIKDLTEALRNFAIESTRIFGKAPKVIQGKDLVALRKACEDTAKIIKFDERGRKKLPSLNELFDDDEEDFFGLLNPGHEADRQ